MSAARSIGCEGRRRRGDPRGSRVTTPRAAGLFWEQPRSNQQLRTGPTLHHAPWIAARHARNRGTAPSCSQVSKAATKAVGPC